MASKSDLVNDLRQWGHFDTAAGADRAVSFIFEWVEEHLKTEGKVAFHGFGVFEAKTRAARTGRNPATGESIEIGEKIGVKFKAAPKMVERLGAKPKAKPKAGSSKPSTVVAKKPVPPVTKKK